MNLVEMTPPGDLCSSGYCLANPDISGAEYLDYLPSGRTLTNILDIFGFQSRRIGLFYLPLENRVKVNLISTSATIKVEWLKPISGTIIYEGTTAGEASRTFTAPFFGDAVLFLYQTDSHPISTPE